MPILNNPEYLWALLIIPFIWYLSSFFLSKSQSKLRKFSLINDSANTFPKKILINKKLLFLSLIICLSIFAITRPKFGIEKVEGKSEGISLAIVIDLSNSMRAEDTPPNRLQRAKIAMEKIITELGNNKIAIIGFAQRAVLISPLSSDISSAKSAIDIIDENFLQNQGTDLSSGINLAVEALSKEDAEYKSILIISDGEDFEGEAIKRAEIAKSSGYSIFTIAVGSNNGAPIPITSGKENDFLKNSNGETVISKANEQILKEIAKIGSGEFARIGEGGDDISPIINSIQSMKKKEFKNDFSNQFADRFQIFLGLALLIFVFDIAYYLPRRRKKMLK